MAHVQRTFEQNRPLQYCRRFHFLAPRHAQHPVSHRVPVEISINAFWHRRTKGDVVLAAWSAVRAAWLSEQMLTYSISLTQANIAYFSAWKSIACFPRTMLSFMSTDCPQTPVPVPIHSPGPIYKPGEILYRKGRVSGPLVHSSVVNIVNLYLDYSLKNYSITKILEPADEGLLVPP